MVHERHDAADLDAVALRQVGREPGRFEGLGDGVLLPLVADAEHRSGAVDGRARGWRCLGGCGHLSSFAFRVSVGRLSNSAWAASTSAVSPPSSMAARAPVSGGPA